MKTILLFGAGKSATCLIDFLLKEIAIQDWQLIVAENNLPLAQSKIGSSPRAKAVALQVENEQERDSQVSKADIVISLLPPALHFLVAGSCIKWKKDLLTASYLDDKIRTLEPGVKVNGLLFLCEMGLDPGIDHMSAVELIHRIKGQGGKIISFKSHTGGLVAPESDDNPWHYKISWNPRNVVRAGAAGAVYKEDNILITKNHQELFENCPEVECNGIGRLAWYPNRNSLDYIPVYGLEEASTFIRTTLRYPAFCKGWKSLVKAGLTDDQFILADGISFSKWASPLLPYITPANKEQFEFLGLFEPSSIPTFAKTSADVLQYLLETRLVMHPADKDMIVMLHELEYKPAGMNNETRQLRSSLVVKGENHLQTAMAKTVGLPLGIAAKMILQGRIQLKGLHIPILPEIYSPVLKELSEKGIRFEEYNS
jgi:saccharopine dehydrogenase (NADP+, L-glutamate forming)